MGVPPQTQSSPHQYSQALQLKLYQAFIFSIPILFSIILFLLFYLFYLKRRATSLISTPSQHVLPVTAVSRSSSVAYLATPSEKGLKGELEGKLPAIVFDEETKAKSSQCCVCLGDYEMKEELVEVPPCRHVFHVDCIALWLRSNSTCPLCRCSVIASIPTCSHSRATAIPVLPPSLIRSSSSH